MGLDMYLIKKANSKSDDEKELGYWRKANQIHAWFIDNVADGDDTKDEMYVSKAQLEILLELVDTVLDGSKLVKGHIACGQRFDVETNQWKDVLTEGKYIENSELAQALLPTRDGFFFGSTDYDQWYIDDLKQTKKIITRALKDKTKGQIIYYASW